MVLGMRIELSEHVCGSGPSWADAPPNGVGVGEGCVVAVGMGVEALTVGVCPTGGDDDSVQAVRASSSPVSIMMRVSRLMSICITPACILLCFGALQKERSRKGGAI